jgi:purine-cytosine permease-like protein
MLKGSFPELWNKAMIYTGSGWLVLVCMIWVSGHFTDNVERIVFVSVLLSGYIAVYMLGFYIRRRHSRKAANL